MSITFNLSFVSNICGIKFDYPMLLFNSINIVYGEEGGGGWGSDGWAKAADVNGRRKCDQTFIVFVSTRPPAASAQRAPLMEISVTYSVQQLSISAATTAASQQSIWSTAGKRERWQATGLAKRREECQQHLTEQSPQVPGFIATQKRRRRRKKRAAYRKRYIKRNALRRRRKK